MQSKAQASIVSSILVSIWVSLACATFQSTPEPAATATASPTATPTPRPSSTPRPTRTPDLAATQHAEELIAEVQAYFDSGYLTTMDGALVQLEDFHYDWAYLGGYKPLVIIGSAGDFFMSAHFKWDSASENADVSGCGFIFGMQPNDDHYAVFLDRTKVDFRVRNEQLGYSTRVKLLRGTGQVRFNYPAEADFTLIVKGAYAYVLVNGEVVGEYALPQSTGVRGDLGLTVLSGTNKGYGTRCERTDLHLWIPNE